MSVTFTTTTGPIKGWAVACFCGNTGPVFGDRLDAVAWINQHRAPLPACSDDLCDGETLCVEAVEEHRSPSINVSNVNAIFVMQALGMCTDDRDALEDALQGGSMDPQDFLGRVLVAESIAPEDEGVPAHEVPGPGARLINCGRSEGYLQDRLTQLHEVADFALAYQREVTWA